jgi:hypothetical protein
MSDPEWWSPTCKPFSVLIVRSAWMSLAALLVMTRPTAVRSSEGGIVTSEPAIACTIQTDAPIAHVDPAYLSFNIDAAELRGADPGGVDFPWSSKRLAARTRHLMPLKLRIGGGAQRSEVYSHDFLTQKLPLVTAMASNMGAQLVWGAAPCKLDGNTCDMSNVEALVNSSAAVGISEWEFGNEPGPTNGAAGGRALGRAFVRFKQLLAARFPNSSLIGPDVGYGAWAHPPVLHSEDATWLVGFLEAAAPVLDGATIHIYPFDHNDVGGDTHTAITTTPSVHTADPTCQSEVRRPNLPWCNYTRVMWPGPGELYDTAPLQDFALPFARLVRQHAPVASKSLRVGETAAVNHGGWDNVTNTFVSGFWNVYQMGWVAQAGYHIMHRQSLTCRPGDSGMGHGEKCAYGVLNTAPDFEPTPDYWLAVLHKRLMGTAVLNTTVVSTQENTHAAIDGQHPMLASVVTPQGLERVVRLFAHCSHNRSGALTLMFANPQTAPMPLSLQSSLDSSPRELYVLTAAADGSNNPLLQSKRVALNGEPLLLMGPAQTLLPDLLPVRAPAHSNIVLPALSYGFISLPRASAVACQ